VVCELCGEYFRTISYTHLRFAHDWTMDRPIEAYKRRFRLESADSELTRHRKSAAITESCVARGLHWDKERVLRTIRAARRKKISFSFPSLQKHYPGLYNGARVRFGSWPAALHAAGLDHLKIFSHHPTWTKEEMLAYIRQEYEAGRLRKGKKAGIRYARARPAACRLFGSWAAALEAAGVPRLRRPDRKWTKSEVRKVIRRRARDRKGLGRSTVEADVGRSMVTNAEKLFGTTWNELVRSLGHEPGHRPWSTERVIQGIRRRSERRRPLNAGAVRETDSALHLYGCKYFGSWDDALRAAGEDPETARVKRRWSQEVILSDIRELAAAGASLRFTDVRRWRPALISAVKRCMNVSWGRTVRMALGEASPVPIRERNPRRA
jgi:hypothetical protein